MRFCAYGAFTLKKVKFVYFQLAQPFFKFMSMLVEFVGGPPGMPPFTQYILQRYWDVSWTASQENGSLGFLTRSNTNRPLESQKKARSLNFRI